MCRRVSDSGYRPLVTRWRFGGLVCWRFGVLVVWWFGGLAVWWFGGLREILVLPTISNRVSMPGLTDINIPILNTQYSNTQYSILNTQRTQRSTFNPLTHTYTSRPRAHS